MNSFKIILVIILVGIAGMIVYLNRQFLLKKKVLFRTSAYAYEDSANGSLNYRLFKPKMRDAERLPMIIYLHGGEQRGDDNERQLEGTVTRLISGEFQKEHPSFVLAPQCPPDRQWLNTTYKRLPFNHYVQKDIPESPEFKMLATLITDLMKKYPIDSQRIYITGFSMGSSGTWDFITRHPDLITAAVPISGVSDTTTAHLLNQIPVWAFHGEKDPISPVRLNQEMQQAINNQGGNCKLTVFEDVAHGCEHLAVAYPGLWQWVFSQQKKQ